jgi:predicted PurR-regulated permease PerM
VSSTLTRRIVVGSIVIVDALALIYVALKIPRTLTVFLIASFIAFGAYPLTSRLEKRMPRAAAIAIVYLGLLGALVVVLLLVVPITFAQVQALLLNSPDYVVASQQLVVKFEQIVRARLGPHVQFPSLADVQMLVGQRVAGGLSFAIASAGSIALQTIGALFIGISSLILSIFFLARGRGVLRSLLVFVPPARRESVQLLFIEIASIFGHFVAGQALLSAIVGVSVWIVLALSHFQFALLVAVVCGLAYSVPFVGMLVAQVLAALLALPQGAGMVLWVSVAIFIIARIGDNVLVPKIMSESIGVSPIGVMFAVFAGGELFGLPGLLLGIPAAALVKVLFRFFITPYLARLEAEKILEEQKPKIEVKSESLTVTLNS